MMNTNMEMHRPKVVERDIFPQEKEKDECRYYLRSGLPGALLEVAEVLTSGAAKHPNETWRDIPAEEHLARAMRHILKYCDGDRLEEHLSHIACRALMALACAREKCNNTKHISEK